MNIDILRPAPTRDAIESERERLAEEISQLKQKKKHTLVGFGCLMLVLSAAGAYLNWRYDTLPWGDFAFALFFAAAAAVAVVVIFIGFFLWMVGIVDKYEESKSTLDNLEDADSKSCLDVVNWLSIPEIDQYRHDVVNQPRKFIVGEINAMRSFFDCIQVSDEEDKIKEACDEVYLSAETRANEV